MDANMTKYASLLQTARADQELGDFKSAYTIYLKAYAIITRMLETQVVFKDKGKRCSIPAPQCMSTPKRSVPDNYNQLVAHAQEILRRIKDIVEQSKPHTPKAIIRTVSPTSLTSQHRQQQPQSRSSSTTAARPRPGSSLPSQSSITSSSQIKKLSKKNIPMIPISPLTKQALINAYALSQATQRFEQAKQGSSPQQPAGMRNLANLRRLIEDVRIQNAKLDAVKAQIQSVSTSTITSWDPDSIARQLTIVDTQLFKDVTVPKDLVRADRKTSQAQHCIDFETYIAHSVAHLLLLEWSVSRHPSPVTTPATSKSHAHLPVNAVAHMIKVAHILLHVYRNFNSFMAVMRALTSPEIKRMRKSWSGVNSKTKDQFKKLVLIYIAKDNARCYKDTLIQKLDAFQDVGKDAVVALPWMRHHMDEVKSIINSYMTGHESTGGSSDVVLSAPGARKLSAVTALLVQCRTNEPGALDRQDLDDKHSQSAFNAKHREPIVVEGLKTPLTPIWDLTSLGTGDIALHHWLLSRPFLNKQQLIDESLEIEPLFHGEELPCYDASFDSDDNGEDDTVQDDFEHVIAPEHDLESLLAASTARSNETPSRSRTPVSETEIDDIMNELLNNDNGDGKDLFDDIGGAIDEEGEEARASDKHSKTKGSPGRTEDVLKFLGIDPDEYSDSDHDDNEGDDKAQPAIKSGKGKGKARDVDDTEEIDTLLAQVKGLVHESRTHAEEVESKSTLTEFDLDEQEIDGGIVGGDTRGDDADQHLSSNRTFEPTQQEHEEDEFGFQAPKPTLAATSDPWTRCDCSCRALVWRHHTVKKLLKLPPPAALSHNMLMLRNRTLRSLRDHLKSYLQ
ncbi:hypothetical protein BGZ98_000993 [Dissophora globulifera]|nr:hypothetical protein BGZ98_000993 [Dissophora globulifera]